MTLQAVPGGDGIPAEPEWSALYPDRTDAEAAHRHWGVVVRELQEAATLTVANGHAILRLVQFRILYDQAAAHVVEHGPVIAAPKTGTQTANLHWSAMRQADEAIRSIEAQLGITPTSRSRAAKVQRKTKTERAADRFLKAAG